MSAQFTTTRLTGHRVLVEGTDIRGNEGTTVLDSQQWDDLAAHSQYHQDVDAFDAAVEEFFAPLTTAAEALEAKRQQAEDPLTYVVMSEGVDGQEARAEVRVRLSNDSILLRLLEAGDTDRLIWVNDTLEVLEAATQEASAEVTEPLPSLPFD